MSGRLNCVREPNSAPFSATRGFALESMGRWPSATAGPCSNTTRSTRKRDQGPLRDSRGGLYRMSGRNSSSDSSIGPERVREVRGDSGGDVVVGCRPSRDCVSHRAFRVSQQHSTTQSGHQTNQQSRYIALHTSQPRQYERSSRVCARALSATSNPCSGRS